MFPITNSRAWSTYQETGDPAGQYSPTHQGHVQILLGVHTCRHAGAIHAAYLITLIYGVIFHF